jgi:hypothetical protein
VQGCGVRGLQASQFSPKARFGAAQQLMDGFRRCPKYLFHYADSKGIVGIYLGPTPSFDFRSVLHDRNLKLGSLDAMEYHITGSETVAACSE